MPKQKCAGELLGRSLRHLQNFGTEQRWPWLCSTPSLLFPFSSSKVPLMSVWGEPRACVLESQWCSTRASACPVPFSVWLCALEEIDASARIPVGWSCRWGPSRSWNCCRVRGGGVPGRAPCRCPASSLVFWSWLTFWTSWYGCWCQCWRKEGGTIED